LRDAADYINGLPKEQSDLAPWQIAIEALMLVAMLARMAFMKALNRNVVLAFSPDARKQHWGQTKAREGRMTVLFCGSRQASLLYATAQRAWEAVTTR
jgi:hypothetical protein